MERALIATSILAIVIAISSALGIFVLLFESRTLVSCDGSYARIDESWIGSCRLENGTFGLLAIGLAIALAPVISRSLHSQWEKRPT